jgi:argininosuccinate lyase
MSNKMWGGRFGSGPDPIMEDINASIDFDRHLYRQDIAASKAHAAMLAKTGIITAQDAKRIAHGLDTILSEIEAGKFKFKRALEDIHMNVEAGSPNDRAGGRTAAHRALAQRSGRDRFPALGARRDRRHRRRRSPPISARWPRKRSSTRRP